MEVDSRFTTAYDANVAIALGCATAALQTIPMAEQLFERGTMVWWSSGDIFALTTATVSGQEQFMWQMRDTWQEGMPADDSSMTVPDGLIQPIRGFGLAWRTNDQVRNAIGWATGGEAGYTGAYQRFERGWLFTTQSGQIYALAVTDALNGRGQYFGPFSGE